MSQTTQQQPTDAETTETYRDEWIIYNYDSGNARVCEDQTEAEQKKADAMAEFSYETEPEIFGPGELPAELQPDDSDDTVPCEHCGEGVTPSEAMYGPQNEPYHEDCHVWHRGDKSEDDGAETVEAEVVDHTDDTTEEMHAQNLQRAQPPEITDEEQFVTEVKGVPEQFVVNMGTRDNKSIHIKKEGYYYLASKMDIDYGAEPIQTSMELDNEKAIYRGWAEKDGQRWENVGTAHLPGEDMQGAKYNLDELAATRAACRALSMATGTGVASMEEMVHNDSNDR